MYEPKVTLVSQYHQIANLIEFLESRFENDSDDEDDTEEEDEECKIWLMQVVYLSNAKIKWAAGIVEKVEKKIMKVKKWLLKMPTEDTHYWYLDTKAMLDKMFDNSLKEVATIKKNAEKVAWIRNNEINDDNHIDIIGLSSKNVGQLVRGLKTFQVTLGELLRKAQEYSDALLWEKKHKYLTA